MQIFELILKIYTLKDINNQDVKEKCTYFIDDTMVRDNEFEKIHERIGLKTIPLIHCTL